MCVPNLIQTSEIKRSKFFWVPLTQGSRTYQQLRVVEDMNNSRP